MVRSICGTWKQPVGFIFSHGACSAGDLKTIIYTYISELLKVGLYVTCCVTDQGPNFVKFSKDVGVSAEKPFFEVNNSKIFYMFDPPHLIKSVRNNLINSLKYGGLQFEPPFLALIKVRWTKIYTT